jgi:hypothetical protein
MLAVLVTGSFVSDGLMEFVSAVAMTLLMSVIASGVLGVALYLLNLPFLFLAMRNPFYRMRFHEVLRLTPAASDGVCAAADEGEIPEAELVTATLAKEPAADD